jgi:hypothetical protein
MAGTVRDRFSSGRCSQRHFPTQQIREFLLATPDHFSKQKRLPRAVTDYEHVHYLLIPRDHWPRAEPTADIAMVEFEAFMTRMSQPENLHDAVSDLLKYEWLPIEGRDFTVRYERSFANGVSIESETFVTYPKVN